MTGRELSARLARGTGTVRAVPSVIISWATTFSTGLGYLVHSSVCYYGGEIGNCH